MQFQAGRYYRYKEDGSAPAELLLLAATQEAMALWAMDWGAGEEGVLAVSRDAMLNQDAMLS